ncbi:MAG: SDR family oxidoreductase, partial [Cyanobacteria bacterium P01_H01_bin.35]
SGLGEKLATQLRQLGEKVVCVKVGDSFGNQGEGVYTLNPNQPDDYNNLLDELVNLNLIPEKVIHLWSLTTEKLTKELDADLFDKAQDVGFYSLLFLAQACGKKILAEQCEIFVISNNIQDVTGNEILQCEKSTILGPVKVISQEYFNFSCRCIDVMLPDTGSNQEKILIEHLIAELIAKSPAQIIAYRGKSRWVENFELFPLKPQIEYRPQKLKEQGVYLITGGLGGIGIVLAEFLAKTVQAKLILIGRSTFPERDNWSEWVKSHDEQDSISQKIQKLQEFETYGAEVLVLNADVSNSEQMELVIQKAEKNFGKINGVIHAAGLVKGNSINAIQNLGKAECQQQFLSKVYGTLVLGKLFKDREIDFCLLMSSISSILGGLGFVAYTASNSFMDYFVRADNHLENNSSWISVNWDSWKLDSKSKQNLSFGKNLAELSITPSEGAKTFEVILSGSNANQLVVSTGDLEARIDQWVKGNRIKKQSNLHSSVDSQQDKSRKLGTVYVAPRNQQEEILADLFQSVLGGTKVGINDDFFDLGGDSLIATMLIAKMKEKFTVDINISEIFNLTTVAQFSEYINSQKESIDSDLEKINQMLELVESTIDD